MQKLTKKQLIQAFQSKEFIQYLGSSMTPQEIDETKLNNWDGGYISRRKLERNSIPNNNRIVFEYTDARDDYRNALYGHGNISYLNFGRGDEFYKHNDFIIIQSKNDFCTIIYRLQD